MSPDHVLEYFSAIEFVSEPLRELVNFKDGHRITSMQTMRNHMTQIAKSSMVLSLLGSELNLMKYRIKSRLVEAIALKELN